MDDPAAHQALAGKDAHLGHQVVLDLGFDLEGARQVDLVLVKAQVSSLFGAHQAIFRLHLGQGHPQLPPQQALAVFGPQAAHGRGAVAPGEGGEVVGVIDHRASIHRECIGMTGLLYEENELHYKIIENAKRNLTKSVI